MVVEDDDIYGWDRSYEWVICDDGIGRQIDLDVLEVLGRDRPFFRYAYDTELLYEDVEP